MDVSEKELQELYTWVDDIPLSRPKRSIARDFSDGVLVAEIVAHYFPRYVELHNYSAASSLAQKMYNWNTLNQKVFKRVGFSFPRAECEAVCNCVPGSVERFLKMLRLKLAKHKQKQQPVGGASGGQAQQAGAQLLQQGGDARGQAEPTNLQIKNLALGENQPGYPNQHSHQQYPHQPLHQQAYSADQSSLPQTASTSGAPPPEAGWGPIGSAGIEGVAAALADRDATIGELRETNEILDLKVRKLEQLVRLKDAKIQTLMAKLHGKEQDGKENL
mmetsp:Transcript_24809/g.34193  ORF Transcript_24809/g.34193 Transcript_24809/m.34193 type:complete len:275 (+) Transcript_24809:32-856(+)|eukprot:CAMPEP_0196594396 /NCGR_PEP_ID=MMETSP1081-20130531/78268_1 /TAXON_ID=36882 /ORGANISM="Pyramimonas amylifera, Strain CCMP720" /LENGTH=274 /DNA_ID=CAMNT_0041918655 /DNA_START=29 /DNA_END=853 /DNA_ORIENTATION=-